MRPYLAAVPLAFALALNVLPPAFATTGDGGRPTAIRPDAAAAPDDGELSAFVAAFLRLVGIQHGYMMMMRGEDDPARLEELKRSALSDMTSAVERDGLTIERYNQIALAVRDDTQVRDRVQGLLQQLAADPSGDGPVPDEE